MNTDTQQQDQIALGGEFTTAATRSDAVIRAAFDAPLLA